MLLSVLFHFLVFLLWPGTGVPLARFAGSADDPIFRRPDPMLVVRMAAPAEEAAAEITVPTIPQQWPAVPVRHQMAAAPTPLDVTPVSPAPGRSGLDLPLRFSAPPPIPAAREGYRQPIAQGILPDWEPPVHLSGVVVTARVYLDAAGDPLGPVELVPPTENQRVNGAIVSRVRTLEYEPARNDGEAVAAWAEITFVFCGEQVKATSPAPRTIPEDPCAREPGRPVARPVGGGKPPESSPS